MKTYRKDGRALAVLVEIHFTEAPPDPNRLAYIWNAFAARNGNTFAPGMVNTNLHSDTAYIMALVYGNHDIKGYENLAQDFLQHLPMIRIKYSRAVINVLTNPGQALFVEFDAQAERSAS